MSGEEQGSATGGSKAPRAAAFFDLDRTLMEGSSAFQFGRAAFKRRLLSRRQIAAYAVDNIRFRLHGSTDETTDRLRAQINDMIAGTRAVDLQRLGPDVLAGILPRVYPQMLDVAWAHQDAGRPIYICTAAGADVADLLARVLRFDGGIGTRSEVMDGVYTGRDDGPFTYREGKVEAMRELAASETIDLSVSYAYSDSESDLPMLEAVGHPVAVNPDVPLLAVARERGWEIMRFDRLGRRLKVGGVMLGAAVAGGIGSALARHLAQPPRRTRHRGGFGRPTGR